MPMNQTQTQRPRLSVLVPAYNEEHTVGRVLDKLLSLPFVDEIVIVDDASTDRTPEIIREMADPRIVSHRMEHNSGKTAAIREATRLATGEILIVQDADLEYDPEEIESVIQPIRDGKADVVYGSRFLVRKAARVLYFYHFLANKFLTFLSNLLTNLNMTDIETCYKAFRAPVLKHLELTSTGFGMEVEITAKISKLPLRIFEVPISYYGRTYEEGKKIKFRDGVEAIWYILRYNLGARFSAAQGRYARQVLGELRAGRERE